MKVLIATPLGEGGKGGIDRIMDEIRRDLAKRPRADLELIFGVTRGQLPIAFSPIYLTRFLIRLISARLGGFDVLHVNLSSHGSTLRKLLITAVARRLAIPYVLHLHGSRFRQYWDGLPPTKASKVRAMFEGASRVVVLGTLWRDYVAEKTRLHADRIVIVPNATPAAGRRRTRGPGEPLSILFLGRIGARKGVPELVEALIGLKERQGWRAVIAGDGDRIGFAEAITAAGLRDRVHFPGWVGPDEVRSLLLSSDILVLPSHDENLPMSVIEGMGAGLAVVVTPVGAVEDIIEDGVTGLIVPVGSPDRLRSAIHRLLSNEALIEELGARAIAFHNEHLNITHYLDKLVSVWAAAARDRQDTMTSE